MKNLAFLFLFSLSISSFGQIPNEISKEEKIYGLSKFWQEVNYNFVYLNNIDKDEWDAQYKRMISEVQETENDFEYYRALQKFCAFLGDGHTNVWFPKEIQDQVFATNFGDYKFVLSNINGHAIISKINQSKKDELPIGTEVITVNGLPTKDHIEQFVKPYISSSTNHILNDWSVFYMLEAFTGSTFDLELKLPNGEKKNLNLMVGKSKEEEMYPQEFNELFEFKWLESDIAYIAFNSFSNWEIMDLFSEKFPEVQKAKKLIIDIRKNGGGDSSIGRELIKYLTSKTVLNGFKSVSRLHVPYYKAIGRWTNAADTLNNEWSKQAYLSFRDQYFYEFPYFPYSTENLKITRIEIPTAILIGHNTASAAEDFLIFADDLENMTKIGEPTFGSTGQPMIFDMPNGGMARICTKEDTYPDGRAFVGKGVIPDIEVKMTLSDYMENKDPALERAIEFLKEKK